MVGHVGSAPVTIIHHRPDAYANYPTPRES
jgi:hypothetical protein